MANLTQRRVPKILKRNQFLMLIQARKAAQKRETKKMYNHVLTQKINKKKETIPKPK